VTIILQSIDKNFGNSMGRVDISFLGKCLNNAFLNNRMKTKMSEYSIHLLNIYFTKR